MVVVEEEMMPSHSACTDLEGSLTHAVTILSGDSNNHQIETASAGGLPSARSTTTCDIILD